MLSQRTGFTKGNPVEHWHSIDVFNAGPVAPQEASTATTMAASFIRYWPLMVRETVTVKKIWAAANSGTANNYMMGLYDAAWAKLIDTGSQTHPGAATEAVVDVTDIVLSRGIYYFAHCTSGGSSSWWRIDATDNAIRASWPVYYESGTSLPATATPLGGGTSTLVVGGVLVNTVVS